MPKRRTRNSSSATALQIPRVRGVTPPVPPQCATLANKGLVTIKDHGDFMVAVAVDMVNNRLPSTTGKAACMAIKNVLEFGKLQRKYGIGATQPFLGT
jgi:hypothetical protein